MFCQVEMSDKSRKSSEKSEKTRTEGNKLYASQKHSNKVHLDILALYNKSAALAENDSEELALAISNRSALLMHLHQYEKSLNDIEKSYQITKCDKLKAKLLARKTKCLTLRDQSIENKNLNAIQIVPIIENVSKTIPCAADSVSIKYDKNYGRFVVATEDIEIGTIIAKEKAVVLLPNPDNIFINGSHCLMLASNGVPCGFCANIIYCSEECKEEAWLQYHDVECLILPYLNYEKCRNIIFVLRLLIKSIKKEGLQNIMHGVEKINVNNTKDEFIEGFFDNKVFQSYKFQSFYNLSRNVEDKLSEEVHLFYIPIIKNILKLLITMTNIFENYNKVFSKNEDLLDFFVKIVYMMKRTVDINTYGFVDTCYFEEESNDSNSYNKIGPIMTPFCSLFNHSCDQNIGASFTKNQEIVIYSIKIIKKGEQIFSNYGPKLFMEKNLRQETLKNSYNFICECEPCKNNWPSSVEEHFDRINMNEIFLKFIEDDIENDISDSVLTVFFGIFEGDVFNKKILQQAIKICQIINKNYSPKKASYLTAMIKRYFHVYYDKFYNIQSFKIFDSC